MSACASRCIRCGKPRDDQTVYVTHVHVASHSETTFIHQDCWDELLDEDFHLDQLKPPKLHPVCRGRGHVPQVVRASTKESSAHGAPLGRSWFSTRS